MPAQIDEQAIRHRNLLKQAEAIARAKAEKVTADYPQAVIIAADTFAAIGQQVLEKPRHKKEAQHMLKLQSGRQVQIYTGFCYLDPKIKINFSTACKVDICFRELSTTEINACIEKFPVTKWSAAFSPFHHLYMTSMIASINGSLTAFSHGLPMELLIPLLRKSGYTIKP